MEVIVIVLAVALVAVVILFGVMLYHQMLLTNSVNQRLIIMTKDAVEKVNLQNDELLAVQEELSRVRNEVSPSLSQSITDLPESDEPFDPHGFDVGNLEDK